MEEKLLDTPHTEPNYPPTARMRRPRRRSLRIEFGNADSSILMNYGSMNLVNGNTYPITRKSNAGGFLFVLALFILPALSLAVAAGYWSSKLPKRYSASADLIIHMQQPGDAVQRYFASQNLIIKAPSLLEPIATSVNSNYEDFSQYVSIDFPKNSNIMRMRYEDADPEQALTVLRKILVAYESVITPIELNESVIHQVVSAPSVLKDPVFPKLPQFVAIGAAIGFIFSMVVFAMMSLLRRPQP